MDASAVYVRPVKIGVGFVKGLIRVLTPLLVFSGLVALFGCGSSTPTALPTATTVAQNTAPVVIIKSPASNASFEEGAQVQVTSTSTSPNGVKLVELIVDGRIVQSSPTPNDQPQIQYSVIQQWQAAPGQHTLTVRATDARANTGDASIIVNVNGNAQPTPIPPTNVSPTTIPATAAPSCTLNATYISDVTFPDDTVIAPNSPFVKTWAIKNSGTCDWGEGFMIVFISGSQLGAPSPAPIPFTAAGQTQNISLEMVSPAAPGRYVGVWQLQASNGTLFGTRVNVAIQVPGAPTPLPLTPVPTVCSGSPQISSFLANPATVQAGQITTLSWGLVSNATNVVLSTPNGNSGVATPGQVQVQPGESTTYTLIAYCYNNSVQAQTTVTVQNAPPPPTASPSTPNEIRSIQVEKNGDNYKVTINYFWDGTDAPASLSAVGVSSQSDPVTNTGQSKIEPNHVKYAIINLTGKGAVTIDVCMLGRSGQELACDSQPVK